LRIHAYALSISLGVYFLFALFDPGLFSYDIRQKFRAIANDTIVVTATVLGAPAQPVVTATSQCDAGTGTLTVLIDWGDDLNTYTHDIDRDSAPLVSGLGTSLYTDSNVTVGTTYVYEVIANGPMGPGSVTSLPVSVTTPALCDVNAQAPSVTIVSFASKSIDRYNGTPKTATRRPVFTGTTNIPNATMMVVLGDEFIAQFTANGNGYWQWRPPESISFGGHVFTIMATDPGDPLRQDVASLRFKILKPEEDEKKDNSGNDELVTNALPGTPLVFRLMADDIVLQGEMLETVITVESIAERYRSISVPVRYTVLDEDGGALRVLVRQVFIVPGTVITENLDIPLYMLSGSYRLQAEILLDSLSVSREEAFLVKELPLIRLSSGDALSYADIIRHLGWILLLAGLLFFIGLLLFLREFALYLRRDGEVTEYDLKKAGFIRK